MVLKGFRWLCGSSVGFFFGFYKNCIFVFRWMKYDVDFFLFLCSCFLCKVLCMFFFLWIKMLCKLVLFLIWEFLILCLEMFCMNGLIVWRLIKIGWRRKVRSFFFLVEVWCFLMVWVNILIIWRNLC